MTEGFIKEFYEAVPVPRTISYYSAIQPGNRTVRVYHDAAWRSVSFHHGGAGRFNSEIRTMMAPSSALVDGMADRNQKIAGE